MKMDSSEYWKVMNAVAKYGGWEGILKVGKCPNVRNTRSYKLYPLENAKEQRNSVKSRGENLFSASSY